MYDTLCDAVRESRVVTSMKRARKVVGALHRLWAVSTPDTTVHAVQPARGFAEAATLLGEDFASLIVRTT
jgi:hypothetical protein